MLSLDTLPTSQVKSLNGARQHLLVRRTEDLELLAVDLVGSTSEAIEKWDWTCRSSPIFLFSEFQYPSWTTAEKVYVFFVGPIDPAEWNIDVPCYATLGTYNILAVCSEEMGHLYDVRDLLLRNPELSWECWYIERGIVKRTKYGGPSVPTSSAKPRRANVAHGLQSAEAENCTLFAAAIAKAHRYTPKVAGDLERFSAAFREKIEARNGDGDNTKLSWLVNVNAALSRFTSQTFAGVSPISATECHFWTHSLLGVGLATQALVNIRRFTEQAVGSADWLELLDQLGRTPLPDGWVSLFRRRPDQAAEWIDAEELMRSALTERERLLDEESDLDQSRMPLIVCFSGRDGFRSTSLTLSAPLEVISQANAYGWSPITLTHEIAHVWINGVLSIIFPDPDDPLAVARMNSIVEDKGILTVLDDLRLAVYFTYTLLEREKQEIPVTDRMPDKPWVEIVEEHGLQVNEALTHILDYQFFYHQDEVRYIKSIWSSWDVIPNIKERLQGYLIRSACALLSERLSHAESLKTTLDRLEELLSDLKNEMVKATYLDDALRILRDDRPTLERKIRNRELLVRIAKTFLTNQPIGARLAREYQEPGGVYSGLEWLRFDYQQIWNPTRFLGHFCRDRRGEEARALWLMAKIAFMQDPNATFA